jgi:hypothetical protein
MRAARAPSRPRLPQALAAALIACGGTSTPPASEPPVPKATSTAAPARFAGDDTPRSAWDVVAAARDGLDACWEQARGRRSLPPAPPATTLEITFDVETDGVAHQVHLAYQHRLDEEAKECFRQAALRVRFPGALAGKQKVVVAFPRKSAP